LVRDVANPAAGCPPEAAAVAAAVLDAQVEPAHGRADPEAAAEAGLMSFRMNVPAAVPSLVHTSSPFVSSAAT